MIGPFQASSGDRAKLKILVRLNLHGMVSIDSATLLEEEEVEVPVVKETTKETTKMETDDGPSEPPTGEADVNMQDAKGAAETPATENVAPESGETLTSEADEKSVQMDTDSKGFRYVAFGPMVHSSYKAGEYYIKSIKDADRASLD